VLAGTASSQFRIPGVPLVSKTVLDTSDSPMLRVIDTEIYENVAGARRYRAAKLAALEQVPVRPFSTLRYSGSMCRKHGSSAALASLRRVSIQLTQPLLHEYVLVLMEQPSR
jgi:hypothetical protein